MGLMFEEFRRANFERCKSAFHTIDSWSETDWATAIAGEVGEACNMIKKRRRGEDVPVSEVGKELADVVTYVDLLCSRLGLKLEDVLASKFNEVSERVGSSIKL